MHGMRVGCGLQRLSIGHHELTQTIHHLREDVGDARQSLNISSRRCAHAGVIFSPPHPWPIDKGIMGWKRLYTTMWLHEAKGVKRGETVSIRVKRMTTGPQPAEMRQPYGPRGRRDRVPGNAHSRTQRPPSEWIAVTVPAIVDPETWERAQGQLQQNLARAQRNTTPRRYLLRSLLVCGRCGQHMVGSWSKQGGRYLCAMRYPRYAPGACTGRSLSAATICSIGVGARPSENDAVIDGKVGFYSTIKQ